MYSLYRKNALIVYRLYFHSCVLDIDLNAILVLCFLFHCFVFYIYANLHNGIHAVSPKKIPDIIDCNLKKDYQILIFLVRIFLTQLAIKRPLKFPSYPMSASALPGEIGTHEIGVEMSRKRSPIVS